MKKNKTRDDLYMEDVPQNTKATVRRLLSRLGRQKGRLLVVTTATLLSSAAYAAIPLLVGMALDNLLAVLRGGASAEQKLSLAAGALFLPVLLLLAASAASSLLAYVQQYVIASVGEELTLSLRQDISRKLGRLPLRYFDSHKTGDILSRITNDLEKVSSVMQVGLMQLISSAFTILLTCVITSLVYMSVIFALSTTFMHVGKGVCVALVILQVPGASGLYPIEMMPAFFRAIYPLLPFTYSIDAMRETIGGFYDGLWFAYIGKLLVFVVLAFALGLGARPKLANLNRLFAREIMKAT